MDRHSGDLSTRAGLPAAKDGVAYPAPIKRNYASRLFGYDIFLSFALGPPPRGTHSYASDLARRLRERDFNVFFSEDEAPPGDQLDSTLRNALLHSKTLVVIANVGTLQEPRWVRKEVEEFRRSHPGRPVITINVGGALQDPIVANSAQEWLDYNGKIWVDEAEDAVAIGIASETLVDRLATAPAKARSNVKWRWVTRGTVAILTMLTIGLAVFVKIANDQRQIAEEQRRVAQKQARTATSRGLAAEANTFRTSDPGLALLLSVAAIEIEENPQALGSLLTTLESRPEMIASHLPGIEQATAFAASPENNILAVGDGGGTVTLWNFSTANNLRRMTAKNRTSVTALSFDARGQHLAIGDAKGGMRVLTLTTGKVVDLHSSLEGRVVGMALSREGNKLAAAVGNQEDIHAGIWNANSGNFAKPLNDELNQSFYFEMVDRIVMRDDGTVALFNWADVYFFSIASGRLIDKKTFGKLPRPGPSALSLDGTLAAESGFDTGSVFLFAPLSDQRDDLGKIQLEEGVIEKIEFSSDKSLVGIAKAGSLRVFESNGRPVKSVEGLNGDTREIAFSADSCCVATLGENQVQVWNMRPTDRLRKIIAPMADVPSAIQGVVMAASSESGKHLAWMIPDERRTIWSIGIWNSETDVVSHLPVLGDPSPASLAFINDNVIKISANPRGSRLIDIRTGKPTVTVSNCGELGAGKAWHFNGYVGNFQRCIGGAIEVVNIDDVMTQLGLSKEDMRTATLSENATMMAYLGGDRELVLVDLKNRNARTLKLTENELSENGDVYLIQLSPNGRRMALVVGGGQVLVYRTDDLLSRGSFQGALRQTISSCDDASFSPDGRWLVTAMGDGKIYLWDADTLTQLGFVQGNASAPSRRIFFLPNGKLLAELLPGGGLTLWDLDPQSWKQKACAVSGRKLSETERAQHISDEGLLYRVNACQTATDIGH